MRFGIASRPPLLRHAQEPPEFITGLASLDNHRGPFGILLEGVREGGSPSLTSLHCSPLRPTLEIRKPEATRGEA